MPSYTTNTEKVSFLRAAFGRVDIARDGINVAISCPSCAKPGKRKLSINIDTWQYHCWVCSIKGKTISSLLRKFRPEFFDVFISKFSSEKNVENELKDQKIELCLPQNFILLSDAIDKNLKDPDIRDCISYVRSRDIMYKELWKYGIGTTRSGKFRRKVIIPSFDFDGELNYIVSRAIDENSKLKYINSKVRKTDIIFNEIHIDWNKELTIVEGPFDMFKSGENSTCLLGSSFGEKYLLFKRIVASQTPVLIALDGDMKDKSHRYAKLLTSYGCNTRVVALNRDKDVGDMSRIEFKRIKSLTKPWENASFLKNKIRSIGSGSLF